MTEGRMMERRVVRRLISDVSSRSLFAPVPEPRNHDRIAPRIDAVSDDIGAGSEWNDQLAIAGPRRRTTAFGLIGKRTCRRKQSIDCAFRERGAMRLQGSPEPFHIGSCPY